MPIVGETRTIRHQETSDTAFIPTSVSVSVTRPDLTLITPAPPVTVTPGSSSVSQTFLADVAFSQGGAYKVVWQFSVGTPLYNRLETYFAFWTDVPALVRQLLGADCDSLTNAQIERDAAILVAALLRQYDCLTTYNALTGEDREWFDIGLAFLIALRPAFAMNRAQLAPVKSFKIGTKVITLADSAEWNIDQLWYFEAWRSLRLIECIGDIYADLKDSFKLFAVGGRRRRAETYYGQSLYNPLYNLIVDELVEDIPV